MKHHRTHAAKYLETIAKSPRAWRIGVLLAAVMLSTGGMSGNGCSIDLPGPTTPSGTTGSGTLAEGGPVLLPDDHVLGDPNAELMVVEYASFTCTMCGRFARQDLPTIKEEYIDTGLICFVFRHYANDANATRAARASECAADQDAFWLFHDALFDDNSDVSEERLKQIAADLSLDETDFADCLAGTSKETRLQQDIGSASVLGVSQNVTFFVGSTRIDGYVKASELKKTIDRALAK